MKTRHIKYVATGHWKAWQKFIPESEHIQSEAEKYTIEGYNSLKQDIIGSYLKERRDVMQKI